MLHLHKYKKIGMFYKIEMEVIPFYTINVFKRLICTKCGKIKNVKVSSTNIGVSKTVDAYIDLLRKKNVINNLEMESKTIEIVDKEVEDNYVWHL